MKEIKDNTNRWKDISCSWIASINTVKRTTLIKAIYRFNAIPIKLSMVFFHRTRTNFFLICMETHKTLNSQNSLEKNRAGGIMLPEFRLYYKVTIIKTAWHCHKIRHIHQRHRIESSDIQSWTYGQLIYNKNTQYRKENLFNKCYWENWTATCKRMIENIP